MLSLYLATLLTVATPYNHKLDFIQCLPRNRLFLGLFRATSEPSNKPLTYPRTSIHRGIQFRQQASGWLPQRAPLAIFTPIVFGVGTVVEVLCGRKLWYVFQHRRTVGNRQDSYIDEYMGDWAPGFYPGPGRLDFRSCLTRTRICLVCRAVSILFNADTEAVTCVPTLTTQLLLWRIQM